ncbi:MAG: CCA tRNA nucleotidyltransferase [Clostridiales bacterium]|nr:CCA tRNA nucleotidyltransferase [Clostridiales bacterium]
MEMKIPKQAEQILRRLTEHGYEAYVVGGCVRDALLGRNPEDWDITTSATPWQVKELFRRTIDTGIAHGTVTVMMDNTGYEVTTYRVDGDYKDGRHPDQVSFTGNLKEDLLRRDFTINAMAYNPDTGLVDEFGGQNDLEEQIIRCVGDPMERLREDALRILRAIRFSAQLGFDIEDATVEAMKCLAPNLQKISAERIRVELDKTICAPYPFRLQQAYQCGVLKEVLPEFHEMMEMPQNHPRHNDTVGLHCLKAVENIHIILDAYGETDRKRLSSYSWCMLLHDVGKLWCRTTDERGIDHFYGHPKESAASAKTILRRLKFDNDTVHLVTELVYWHDYRFPDTPQGMRRAMNKIGPDLVPMLFRVELADLYAQSGCGREESIHSLMKAKALWREIIDRNECVTVKDLAVNGRDLIAAGIPAGKQMGELLSHLLSIVITEPEKNCRETLIKEALEYRKETC